jgi:4-oxalocrotonate tautomerase
MFQCCVVAARNKKDFMKKVASVAMRTLDVPEHAVVILLTELEHENWSIGNESMTEIHSDKPR